MSMSNNTPTPAQPGRLANWLVATGVGGIATIIAVTLIDNVGRGLLHFIGQMLLVLLALVFVGLAHRLWTRSDSRGLSALFAVVALGLVVAAVWLTLGAILTLIGVALGVWLIGFVVTYDIKCASWIVSSTLNNTFNLEEGITRTDLRNAALWPLAVAHYDFVGLKDRIQDRFVA